MSAPLTIKRMQAAGAPPRLSGLARWADRHFKWLLVAPAVLLILALSIYPLLFSLVVSFINYDFQVPGHAFVGLKNFERVVFDPGGALVAAADGMAFGCQRRHRIRSRAGCRADDGAQFSRPRSDHVDPDRAAVHQPGHRRPGLDAASAAALRADQLHPQPGPRTGGHDRLDDREPLALRVSDRRRRLAMDAVHVRHPAGRPDRDPAKPLRGGGTRRSQRLAGLLGDHACRISRR